MRNALFLLCTITLLYSTTITGNIVNGDTLQKMNNTLITLENENGALLIQKFFNEGYTLDTPSGAYLLRAYHYFNGSVDYYNQYKIQATQPQMNLDVVLLPYELAQMIPDYTPPPLADENKVTQSITIQLEYVLAGIAAVALVAIAAYLLHSRKKTTQIERKEEAPAETHELDEDCTKALKIIEENEGRIVQKELREILNFSETKMSLIVAELEACGRIRRIKKGRENILKLVKK